MTEYVTIEGVRLRTFTIPATLAGRSEETYDVDYPSDILWDDDSTILWDDNSVIEWSNTTTISPYVVTARKRSFVIPAKVND